MQALKKENEQLKKQLAAARKQLEEETIARVDLENRVQSLKEELSFKSQVHEQVRQGWVGLWRNVGQPGWNFCSRAQTAFSQMLCLQKDLLMTLILTC